MKAIEKIMQQLIDSYNKQNVPTVYVWDEWIALEHELQLKGFSCSEITGFHKNGSLNKNFVYHKIGYPYVFILIFTASEDKVFPLVMDADVYENLIKYNKHISILKHHKRPVIGTESCRIVKLHKAAMNMVGDDSLEIDHITHSSNICVKKFMRVCNTFENRYNRAIYMNITDDDEFVGTFTAINKEQENYIKELNCRGFYVEETENPNEYLIYSDDCYEDESKMIADINEIEKTLQGEYRYNPLLDCSHPISQLIMIRHLMGLLSKEDYLAGQKYFLQQTKSDFFLNYYRLNK